MTMFGLNQWISFILFVCYLAKASALSPPSNGRITSLNLNYTFSWSPATLAEEDGVSEIVFYTVENMEHTSVFKEESAWSEISGCINITRTTCNLLPVFSNSRSLSEFIVHLRVGARVSQERPPQYLHMSFHPDRYVNFTAPSISVIQVTESLIRVELQSPYTPYLNATNGMPLRVAEKAPFIHNQIMYFVSIEEERKDNNSLILTKQAEFGKIEFSDLKRSTRYNVVAFSMYESVTDFVRSINNSSESVKTSDTVPSCGPKNIQTKDVLPLDCTQPGGRVTNVSWEASCEDNNDHPTFYEIRLWRDHRYDDFDPILLNVTDRRRTFYSILIHNISRWQIYQMIVSANTSAGGNPGSLVVISANIVDIQSCKPENLNVTRASGSLMKVMWKSPSRCIECIAGYNVGYKYTLKNNTPIVKTETVQWKQLAYFIPENSHEITEIFVITLLRSGLNQTQAGLKVSLTLEEEERSKVFILPVVVITTVFLILVVGVIVYTSYRYRRKHASNFKSMLTAKNEDPDFLAKYIDRQCSQLSDMSHKYSRRIYVREPEVFDSLSTSGPPTFLDNTTYIMLNT